MMLHKKLRIRRFHFENKPLIESFSSADTINVLKAFITICVYERYERKESNKATL